MLLVPVSRNQHPLARELPKWILAVAVLILVGLVAITDRQPQQIKALCDFCYALATLAALVIAPSALSGTAR
ncbi:hypothetical protein ABH920_003335 [Catenulispora sp. EB89]|uniref:hypothetical protein n=1 Tax=Catenulispora sp. EB89 TaxID=3156257 RepID=UPI0035125402